MLLGALPDGVTLTKRATEALAGYRSQRAADVHPTSIVIRRDDRGDWRWWTWAGAKANRTLAAWAPDLIPPRQRLGAESVRLHSDLTRDDIRDGIAAVLASNDRPLPAVDARAVKGLKFSAALPIALAQRTLAVRGMDTLGATAVLRDSVSYRIGGDQS